MYTASTSAVGMVNLNCNNRKNSSFYYNSSSSGDGSSNSGGTHMHAWIIIKERIKKIIIIIIYRVQMVNGNTRRHGGLKLLSECTSHVMQRNSVACKIYQLKRVECTIV